MDELRDKYLQGLLSEAEKEAFESQLSDAEKEELAFELGVRDELRSKQRKKLKEQISGFEESVQRQTRVGPFFWLVAASTFLVTSLVWYVFNQPSLFDQYHEVYPNYEVTALRGEEELSNRELAYSAYDRGDYSQAVDVFNELDSLQTPDYFFRGVSYIQLENYQASVDDFRFVIDTNSESYATASKWYSALIYLKLENKEKAIPILTELSKGQSEFQETSLELLKKL